MKIYRFDRITREEMGFVCAEIDELESQKAGHPVYLTGQLYTCLDEYPQTGPNEKARRLEDNTAWEVVADYRNSTYYDKDTGKEIVITELGVTIPEGYPIQPPVSGLFNPRWNGSEWIETAIIYQGQKVTCKADVDRITKQKIINLGEEKAKTEKLISGSGECPIWDDFVAARAAILQEGDAFITANNLT
ncbi:MAG: hypothetical protein ABFD50_21635 [Smithella sp.]